MLVLTAATGRVVRAADGRSIGQLLDLSALQTRGHPHVHRLAVGSRRRVSYLLPWAAVQLFEHTSLTLRADVDLAQHAVARGQEPPLILGELLLVRDVLDTQIIDVSRHRIGRVSDVLLRRSDGDLTVVAVEIGSRGILRRIGLRRLGLRLPEQAIDWNDLHLTSERGHATQLETNSATVHRLDSDDLAELLTRLSAKSGADILGTVDPARAARAFARTHPVIGNSLIRALPGDDAARLVDEMPREDAAHYRRLIAEVKPSLHRRYRRLHGWRLNRPPAPPRDQQERG